MWPNQIPPWEGQYSAITHTDVQDCVSESLVHIVFMLTGFRASPRALAYLAPTSTTGSTVNAVLAAANFYGLIPYDLWPTPDSFTWESYYADIPQNIIAQGLKFGIVLAPANLDTSPLWTELQWGIESAGVIPERHMVAQINQTQYFDSEQGSPVKPLNYEGATIQYQASIKLTKNPMNNYVKTMCYIDPTGNKTVGIFTPLATEAPEEIAAFNNLYNISLAVNADKSINTELTVKNA